MPSYKTRNDDGVLCLRRGEKMIISGGGWTGEIESPEELAYRPDVRFLVRSSRGRERTVFHRASSLVINRARRTSLPPAFVRRFITYRRVHYERIGNHPKTRASRSGRPEHGVLFPKSVFILKRRVLINVFHRHDDLLRYQFVRVFDTHTRARARVLVRLYVRLYVRTCTRTRTYARVHAHARTHTDVVHPSMKCILT